MNTSSGMSGYTIVQIVDILYISDVSSTSFVDEDLKDLLEFPMSEAFTDPLKLLHLDKTTMHDDESKKIKHWSHNHPLILNVDHQVNNMYGIISSDPIERDMV
uniref:Uncharacterized protein n=1 Tax=Lactuca sativa TaxID=4236 RepID=A0A9R1V6H8_LACSA|nr:hypothetical protein LSAT_V11C600329170 [Lactuca sativa]